MPIPEMRPESVALFRAMSGAKADHYIGEVLVPSLARSCRASHSLEALSEQLQNSYRCLEMMFGHYAFARRGRDRFELSEIALEALHRTCKEDEFGNFLALDDAESLWISFDEICRERGRKSMEQLNVGVIAGIAELAQDIFRQDSSGNIALWIARGVLQTRRIEPQFLRMVDVRGIGPKITSLILRDIVLLFDLEQALEHSDRLYVQPIDKWMRAIAPFVIEEPNAENLADWILAGKLSKYARKAGVSGIRFNMGTTWFGMREVRAPEFFESTVRQAIRSDINPAMPSVVRQ